MHQVLEARLLAVVAAAVVALNRNNRLDGVEQVVLVHVAARAGDWMGVTFMNFWMGGWGGGPCILNKTRWRSQEQWYIHEG